MLSAILGSALAIAVQLVVALALLTFVLNALSRLEVRLSASFFSTRDTLTTLCEQLRDRVSKLESEMKTASGTHAAVEVAALAADVDKLSSSMRKQFGRVFAELHMDGTLKRNAEAQQDVETSEQVRERLRLAHGLPRALLKQIDEQKLGGVAIGNGKPE